MLVEDGQKMLQTEIRSCPYLNAWTGDGTICMCENSQRKREMVG